MQKSLRILFAAGGTGGHVYPAIAIAGAVKRNVPDAVVAFAGTKDHLECRVVPDAGYTIYPITVSGFHRKQPMRNVLFPVKLVLGISQSYRLIGAFDPDVVVGTGGFVSGPVLLAASLRRRATLIQEQNAFPGITNRLLASRVDRIHVAFPEAKAFFHRSECVLSGNPTRAELRKVSRAEGRRFYNIPHSAVVLFAFGGSLGSAALNNMMERYYGTLLKEDNLHIVWQTGAIYYPRFVSRVKTHPRLHLLQYVDRMDMTYAAADLAICRAGAITCSELLVTGTPAILVPSPNVAEDHQTKNARSLEQAGAAVLLPELQLNEKILDRTRSILGDEKQRLRMKEAATRIARPDADEIIARDIIALVSKC